MTVATSPLCECPVAGYCNRYRRKMLGSLHAICAGQLLSPSEQAVYRSNWARQASGKSPVRRPASASVAPRRGPGTCLKEDLEWWGVAASGCGICAQRALEMDIKGCAWCRENIDTIIGWLREAAARRNLPFPEPLARMVLYRAISRAERDEANSQQQLDLHRGDSSSSP